MSEDKAELYAAIAALQGKLPRVAKGETAKIEGKDGKPGHSYKYADLADVSGAISGLLSECGLGFIAKPTMKQFGERWEFVLHYDLVHKSGQSEDGDYPLPDPRQARPQQVGSAITYARRYSLCAATGLAPDGDDDDAGAAQTGFRPSAGDMFDSASAQPSQQGRQERQWTPRAAPAAQAEPPAAGSAPEAEGAFVAKFYVDLTEAQDEAAVRGLQAEVGKAIRATVVTPPVGNELLGAARDRMAQVRSAA